MCTQHVGVLFCRKLTCTGAHCVHVQEIERVLQGAALRARSEAHSVAEDELAKAAADAQELRAERDSLAADLAATRSALAAAESAAADARAELEQHSRDAAGREEAAQKVPGSPPPTPFFLPSG